MASNNLPEVIFSRSSDASAWVERLVGEVQNSLDAAIYRFNHRGMYRLLNDAADRGVEVRLVIDRNKYEESDSIRELMVRPSFAVRLSYGRLGPGSKMHHKFAVMDRKTVVTGSFNWTTESEDQNFENLVLLREARQVDLYREEFETLWSDAKVVGE
jgi:phosphatidylserine/phosphatidylglycerophosphate/cardiolipin synthase-like enzyme